MEYKKYFSGFSSLWKTQRALQDFLNEQDCTLDTRKEILTIYRPKVTGKNKSKITRKDIADRVFSEYIRLKYSDDGNCVCVTCLKKDFWRNMQAGHYRSRDCLKYRFSEDNVFVQCYYCNVILNGNYRNYKIFMDQKFGKEKEEQIWNDKELVKITQTDYMEMIWDWYGFIKNIDLVSQ